MFHTLVWCDTGEGGEAMSGEKVFVVTGGVGIPCSPPHPDPQDLGVHHRTRPGKAQTCEEWKTPSPNIKITSLA